jgi:ribosome-binding factor A
MGRCSSAAAVAALVLCALQTTGAFTQTPFRGSLVPAARSAAGAWPVLPACSASNSRRRMCAASALTMSGRRMRVSPRNAPGGSSAKRAGRLGKLVMTELVGILRSPYSIKVAGGDVDAELASLISIVEVDMSGDNKVAKVMVSAMGSDVEKKRAVMWLNKNARAIRFSLAQRISYLKTVPELRFTASALPEAMEVMSILDQLRAEREARAPADATAEDEAAEGEREVLEGLKKAMATEDGMYMERDVTGASLSR